MRKLLKWLGWAFAFSIVILMAIDGKSDFASVLTLTLSLLIFGPFAVLLVIQSAFFVYHWVAHGDPFYEPATDGRNNIIYVTETPKRQKKMCPICQRPTRCKWNKSSRGVPYHIKRD